jgi:Fe-S cluster assembly protein SufD
MAAVPMLRYEAELSALVAQAEARAGEGPGWLREMRAHALARHRELGIPTPKNEEWKYTPLRPLVGREFAPAAPGPAVFDFDLPFCLEGTRVVLVNGRLDRNQLAVRAQKGLTVKSLRDAIAEDEDLVRAHLGRVAKADAHTFASLSTALFEDGLFVHIARGAVVEGPIEVVHVASGEGQCVATRVLVVAEEGSMAKLVETYVSDGDGANLVLPVTEVHVGEGANLEHVRVQDESESGFSAALWSVVQGAQSEYRSYNVVFGGSLARADQEIWLGGSHTVTRLDGVVAAHGKQHIDNHTRLDHAVPECNSFEVYKQVVDDEATVVFNGKIFVHQDAQKTDAVQNNAALLLSPRATIDSKPQLEIFADDVKCTHGATVGRLEDTPLFYLRSRGVPRAQAEGILVYAFAAEVLELISLEPLRNRLESRLLQKLAV